MENKTPETTQSVAETTQSVAETTQSVAETTQITAETTPAVATHQTIVGNVIELVQNPILKHKIVEIGKSVTQRIESLNLKKLIVNEDSIQSIKKLRAELNKENVGHNSQYKTVYDVYMSPITEIKELYQANITNKFKDADTILKDAVGVFEIGLKDQKKKNLISYFNELCTSEKIDFVKFENVITDINLSTTEKKYKEQILAFINKVIDDLSLIKSTNFEAEILTEYKVTLNASKAITSVTERKEKEKIEAEKIKAAENLKRIDILKKIGFTFIDITGCYEYDTEIYLSVEDIYNFEKEKFNKTVAEFEALINDKRAKKLAEEQRIKAEEQQQKECEPQKACTDVQNKYTDVPTATIINEPIQKPVAPIKKTIEIVQKPVTPLQKPIEVVQEKQLKATFEVIATRNELLKLKDYLVNNNLNYKNI